MSAPRIHPALSIIIPMFQSGPTIERAVRSALGESDALPRGGCEVIVIDDGSTDDGPALVDSIARSEPGLRVLRQPNAGVSAARNAGIAAARGTWLRFLDADDWVTPGSSARLIGAAQARSLSAACGSLALADEQGHDLGRTCLVRSGTDATLGLGEFLDANSTGR
jgi:glycosyltransferase involved in cell wall biosynthesis